MKDDGFASAQRRRTKEARRLRVGSSWKHQKTGGVYQIENVAVDEKTGELLVVYVHVETGKVWVRPLSAWEEQVQLDDGTKGPRFVRAD